MLRLKIWRESVALFQIDNREYFVFRLYLWVMKEYGAVKSWTKLDNTILLLNEDWGAIVVDFKTEKEMAATALDGYPSMNPFVESLILLSQSNVVSY
ncbi:F-box/kelch-repeat protein [Pyrus ussuriensis x Pyrus communis]|uniref:F-box/kelch-repeat protein n=1 Tax=Pyrus ussuriensis x Pyrus communis TaxID=2448454 RepID=A0A5N5FLK6_9ROSA|nr:F-box/kelch-repeat protein [Pyrus ussuriensis x Pyrus communis]